MNQLQSGPVRCWNRDSCNLLETKSILNTTYALQEAEMNFHRPHLRLGISDPEKNKHLLFVNKVLNLGSGEGEERPT